MIDVEMNEYGREILRIATENGVLEEGASPDELAEVLAGRGLSPSGVYTMLTEDVEEVPRVFLVVIDEKLSPTKKQRERLYWAFHATGRRLLEQMKRARHTTEE